MKIMIKGTDKWVKKPDIIAVDYDGTIDFAGFPKVGKIDEKALNTLKHLQNKGVKIILWTCRAGKYLDDAVECCKRNGLVFDAVNENIDEVKKAGFESPKVLADYYIDDRGLGMYDLDKIWEIFSKS